MAAPTAHTSSRASGGWSRLLQIAAALGVCSLLAGWAQLGARHGGSAAPLGSAGGGGVDGDGRVAIGWAGMRDPYTPRPASGLTLAEAQGIATDNSGNMVWDHAARALLHPNATRLVWLRPPPHDARVAAVLMPTANLLVNASAYASFRGPTQMLAGIADAQRAPLMLVGIGSQVRFAELRRRRRRGGGGGSADGGAPGAAHAGGLDVSGAAGIRLAGEQVQLLRRVQRSGGFVAARGRFTAAILEANGLPPPLPLGCPSLLLNHNPRLGEVLRAKWAAALAARDPGLRLAVTLPALSEATEPGLPAAAAALLARLFRAFPNSVAVLQTRRDERLVGELSSQHGLCLPAHRVRHYYDVASWVAGLAACCDLVFGFRIHGQMAALAAEVPGLLVATDMRISELADSMRLPAVDLDRVDLAAFELFGALAAARDPYPGFDHNRRRAAAAYASEFGRLGVPLHPGVAALAAGGE